MDRADATRRDRCRARAEVDDYQDRERVASRAVEALATPETSRLDAEEDRLNGRLSGLWELQPNQRDRVAEHPKAAMRLDDLGASRGSTHAGSAVVAYRNESLGSTWPALGLARRLLGSAIWALISAYKPYGQR